MAIEKGTIKVVWITKNTRRIYSRMFSNPGEAKIFGEGKRDYLAFRLVRHKGFREFSWTLLPYGKHKLYRNALQFYLRHKKTMTGRFFGF